jgi:hypothetical protein
MTKLLKLLIEFKNNSLNLLIGPKLLELNKMILERGNLE